MPPTSAPAATVSATSCSQGSANGQVGTCSPTIATAAHPTMHSTTAPAARAAEAVGTAHRGGRSKREDVPVVFLSARAQDADVDRGKELGAAAYLTKPFDPGDLLDLIEELVAE